MCQTRLGRDEFMAYIFVMKREPNPNFALFIVILFLNSMFNYWFTTVIRVHQILLFYFLFCDVKIYENHMTKVFWCMNGCFTVAVCIGIRYWRQEFVYNSFVSLLVLTRIKDFNKWQHKSVLSCLSNCLYAISNTVYWKYSIIVQIFHAVCWTWAHKSCIHNYKRMFEFVFNGI